MNDSQLSVFAISNFVVAKVLFAMVALGKLYNPTAKGLLGFILGLAFVLSTLSAVAEMARRGDE